MSYISDNHRCSECGLTYTMIVKREKRDDPSNCPECMKMSGSRTISAPALMTASYPDGRKRGDTYQKLKEAAKLEAESMNVPVSQRGEYKKMISELKK